MKKQTNIQIFLFTIFACLLEAVLITLIPQSAIQKQCGESVIADRFYVREHTNMIQSFREVVHGKVLPNRTYSRYWHGSMVLLRPLLPVLLIF